MKFLLDTNMCIYIIKKSPPRVFSKLRTLNLGDVGISSVTFCELQCGVANSTQKESNQNALNEFLSPIEIFDFPGEAAPLYGETKVILRRKGISIGALDLPIGVHALYLGIPVVTNNTKEFSRIPKLSVKNWV